MKQEQLTQSIPMLGRTPLRVANEEASREFIQKHDILNRSSQPGGQIKEMSLLKRFTRLGLKTPASRLVSTVRNQRAKGLTPVIEDLAELDLSSKKKNSADDFAVGIRSTERLVIPYEVPESLSVRLRLREPEVAKQLNELFQEDAIGENQML